MQNPFLIKRIFILLILSYAFFFFGNSFISLTDPDEVFYTLTVKEMAEHSTWMTPYIFDQPQFEKPILTYWLLKIASGFGGYTPFNMRFFPALFAALGVLGVYLLGLIGFRNERRAFWSAVILCTGAFYVGMGKTVFTDMIFAVFILYSLLSFYWAFAEPAFKKRGILGFYVFAALAVLTKGPLGLGMAELTILLFLLYRGNMRFIYDRIFLIGFALFLLIALPWYALMVTKYGQAFIHEFFYNDHWRRWIEAEHKSSDRWYFYPVTIFAGLFPWTVFLVGSFIALFKKLKWGASTFEYFILSWILIMFLVLQPAHSKLASYILPVFPALALLAGGYIVDSLENQGSKIIRMLTAIMGGFFILMAVGVAVSYPIYKDYLSTQMPAYLLASMLIILGGAIWVLLLKGRVEAALGVLSLSLLPFLFTAFIIKADIEPYASSKDVASYLPHQPGIKTVILSIKPYARGLRYYTGQDIAVIDINGRNYFSPHPIPILTTTDQLMTFLRSQKLTYAVVKNKKGADKTLHELPVALFNVKLYKTIGYNSILTIETLSQ